VDELAQVTLLADDRSVRPGGELLLGVRFKLKSGWHVYWSNPGDSGQPPEVAWSLPAGVQIGSLQFPVPKKFEQAGGIVGYGYDEEVVLLARATMPRNLSIDSPLRLEADVSFLVCDESACVPGKTRVSIELPVVAGASEARDHLLGRWIERLPQNAGGADAPRIQAQPVAASGEPQTVAVTWDAVPTAVEWFPPASEDLTFTDIVTKTDSSSTTVSFRVEPLARKRVGPVTLDSLLAYTVGGQRKGVLIPLEIVAPPDADAKSSQR